MNQQVIKQERDDLYHEVYASTDSIDQLVNPSDVEDGAGSWSEVDIDRLHHEIHRSVEIAIDESHHDGAIQELAIMEWLNDMPRVKMEDMVFSTRKEALAEGYWPYDLSRMGAKAKIYMLIQNQMVNIPHTARNKARNLAKKALADKYDPLTESPER